MQSTATPVDRIPPLEHEEAMRLAQTEYQHLIELVDQLTPEDWTRPTDCTGWDVTAVLAHVLGMLERNADPAEAARQNETAHQRATATGELWIDALTALQVADRAHLRPPQLATTLRTALPRSLAARSQTTAEQRAMVFNPGPPHEAWTFGYLIDVIHTRDPWMHRIDICRATGGELTLTPDHDGRIVADVVAEWARRHGQPCTVILDGPAGGVYTQGEGGAQLHLDAVEFCRALSGRGPAEGLLAHQVPF
ncbi:MAG: maleylpyruvate isomerase family mycothiol-dependent enzyme [Pseudonocardiaceae bacterium]